MDRLKRYLMGLFASEAVALFAVAISLIFLVECLRVVDAGSVRGQGLLTLGEQVLLALPSTSMAFIHICIGIGMARALRTLQATRELHILHVSGKLPALAGATAIYAALGALLLLVVAHVVDPAASRENSAIRSRIAADLIGRSLVPNRFAEVADGVTVTVGGRKPGGEITSFFADDRREPTRRTYISQSALIAADEQGYVLQLSNGTVQYRSPEGKLTEIAFDRYDMPFERLTGPSSASEERLAVTSITIVAEGLRDGWTNERLRKLTERTVEGLRAISICLFVFALAAFPSGRRREARIPLEITVLGASFFERLLSIYSPAGGWLSPLTGVVALAMISLLILLARLKPLARPRREARA
jgi:lipopolysaccharide export system permease protein